jgi:hypothetical protein
MKLRSGFVSNSSTSSFLIYGTCFEGTYDLYERLGIKDETEEDEYSDQAYEVLSKLEEELGLEHHAPDYDDYIYLGKSWDKVGDNETGAEFKARIEKILKDKFGDDIELDTHEFAWRDG